MGVGQASAPGLDDRLGEEPRHVRLHPVPEPAPEQAPKVQADTPAGGVTESSPLIATDGRPPFPCSFRCNAAPPRASFSVNPTHTDVKLEWDESVDARVLLHSPPAPAAAMAALVARPVASSVLRTTFETEEEVRRVDNNSRRARDSVSGALRASTSSGLSTCSDIDTLAGLDALERIDTRDVSGDVSIDDAGDVSTFVPHVVALGAGDAGPAGAGNTGFAANGIAAASRDIAASEPTPDPNFRDAGKYESLSLLTATTALPLRGIVPTAALIAQGRCRT